MIVLACLSCLAPQLLVAKTPWSSVINESDLRLILPEADYFSEKQALEQDQPPVYSAYKLLPNGQGELLGYAFLSADIPPEEKGYSAPIDMLIGLNVDGHLTGIKVLDYIESFRYSRGDFIASEGFQDQFQNKSIEDVFRLHQDIDAITNATISSWAITRGVRNAARRVATAYLDYQPEISETEIWNASAAAYLATLSWEQVLQSGLIVQKEIPTPIGTNMILSIAYMGRPALGNFFVGEKDYGKAERDASIRFDTKEIILFAVGGDTSQPFQQQRLSFQQGNNAAKRVHPRRLVSAGSATEGILAGRAEFAGGIVMDKDFDPTQAFSVLYRVMGQEDPIILRYQFKEKSLALATRKPSNLAEERENQTIETSWLFQLRHGALWLGTDWLALGLLVALLVIVSIAFWTKNSALRWLGLSLSFAYLGFIDGGFLSVSHLAGLAAQGPGNIIRNLPLLLLFLFTLITTLLWGRLFCASLCPFGALQDIISRFIPKKWKMQPPNFIHLKAYWIKYAFLAIIIGMALFNNSISVFQYFEPFGTLFYFSTSYLLWGILLLILVGCVFIERFYCRYACPLGAALAIIAVISPFKIKRVPQCNICKVCENSCPTGAIDRAAINFKECVRCDICEIKLIEQAGSCRHSVEEITKRSSDPQIVKFINP